jgi:hypothetical protein
MLAILAQQNNANDPPEEFIIGLLAVVCGFYLVLLIVLIFFLLTLSKTLSQCRPENRTMEPGQVWLNLIPIFNLAWMFITVLRLSESLKNEYYDRGWNRRGEDYGQGLGIATCSLIVAANIPYIGCIFFLGWMVCFILYWMRMSGYGTQLASRPARYDDYDDRRRDDDYDDRDDRRDDYDDRRPERPWDRGGR